MCVCAQSVRVYLSWDLLVPQSDSDWTLDIIWWRCCITFTIRAHLYILMDDFWTKTWFKQFTNKTIKRNKPPNHVLPSLLAWFKYELKLRPSRGFRYDWRRVCSDDDGRPFKPPDECRDTSVNGEIEGIKSKQIPNPIFFCTAYVIKIEQCCTIVCKVNLSQDICVL